MKFRIALLLLLFVVVCGYNTGQSDIFGKYYNLEDDQALHYLELKEDGSFFHYYKKASLERSHSGKWTLDGNKIRILGWEEYSTEYLKIISGMGEVKFGETLVNQIFWIRGSFLNPTPGANSAASYIKEEEVARINEEKKKRDEAWRQALKGKDTIYYPNSKIIKAIGSEGSFRGEKVKNHVWQYFYETGELESEGGYIINKRVGIWKFYHKNGQLSSLGLVRDSLQIGTWEYYYDNGKIKEKGVYINIKKTDINKHSKTPVLKDDLIKKRGTWSYYDSNGKLKNSKVFESREKFYDSLYINMGYNTKIAIDMRNETIELDDKPYKTYQASLTAKDK